MNIRQRSLLLISTFAIFTPVYAQCPKGEYCVNLARTTTSGQQVRGPVTIVLKNVNVLRYDIKINESVAFNSGPDLSKLGLIPPITGAAPAPPPTPPSELGKQPSPKPEPPSFKEPDWKTSIQTVFGTLQNDYKFLQNSLTNDTASVTAAINSANAASAGALDLVRGSDSLLQTEGGSTAIISQIGSLMATGGIIEKALAPRSAWPEADIANLATQIDQLKGYWAQLPTKDPVALADKWSDWYSVKENKTDYDAMKSGLADLASKIAMIGPDSDKAKAYKATITTLTNWRTQLIAIQAGSVNNGNPFEWSQKEGCGFAFSNNKPITVTLSKVDRLASPPTTPPVAQQIVTVVCSSPVTISAGFGFAKLKETDFEFVQSAGPVDPTTNKPTVVSKIGLASQSGFRVVPAVLINTRIYEFDKWDQALALHFSSGAAVKLSSGAVGNEVEYILGGSLSFRRNVLVTIGGEVGRVSTLAGGFNVGDVVPTGLSSPPLQKKWALGPAVFITYIFR